MWHRLSLKSNQLTIDDRCKDSHALEVWITHCPVQYKASKTGNHKHGGNQNHIQLLPGFPSLALELKTPFQKER